MFQILELSLIFWHGYYSFFLMVQVAFANDFLIFICSSATVWSPRFAVERILWQRKTLLLAPRQRHLQSPQVRFPLRRSCTEAFDFRILQLSGRILFPLTIPYCRQHTTSNSPGSINSILQIVMTREWSYTCSTCNPIYFYSGIWDPICFILQNKACFFADRSYRIAV